MSIEIVEGIEARIDMRIEITELLLEIKRTNEAADNLETTANKLRQESRIRLHRVAELSRALVEHQESQR